MSEYVGRYVALRTTGSCGRLTFLPMEHSKIIGPEPGSVHIEARLLTTGRPSRHHVDIIVYGSDDALRGSGWVTTLAGSDGCSTSRSLFSQHGSSTNGIVRLTGVTLHSSDPRDVGAQVITEADTSTGVLHITAESLNGISVQLEGIGTVIAAATQPRAPRPTPSASHGPTQDSTD